MLIANARLPVILIALSSMSEAKYLCTRPAASMLSTKYRGPSAGKERGSLGDKAGDVPL